MAARKKTSAKKTSAKKASTKSKTTKSQAAAKPPTKTQVYAHLADSTGLSKKQIGAVFDSLGELMQQNLAKRGPGAFTVPGLMKVKVVRKPATKARKGVHPFTGEDTVFKAKPARNVVKVQPLKALKDMV